MRLQFEAKLNSMHSDYRELNTKYGRASKDLSEATSHIAMLTDKMKAKVEENTDLNQTLINERSRMNTNVEKI